MFFISLIIAAFLALIPANIAKSKGRSFGKWWFYGWMLFIVALVHSLLLKDPEEEAFKEQQKQFMETAMSGNNPGFKANPRLAKKIEISANATPDSLLKRAYIFLEDKDWDSAYAYCEAVLDADPERAEAYLGKLLAEYEISEKSELANCAEPFNDNLNYKKIVHFGSDELIDELSGYIEHIKIRNENARVENIYVQAKAAFDSAKSENDFKAAAENFKLIPEYKDSAELAKKCVEKANEIKAENERKAEADKAALETRNKKNKKIAAIVTPIVALAIAAVVIFTTVIQPMMDYNAAVSLMEEGKYEEAVSGFMALGNYKDSKEQIYIIACNYMDEKQYKEASDTFKLIREYNDSEKKEADSLKKYIKTKKVGETIEFGSYEQDNNLENGKEPIKWKIVAKEDGKVCVLSEKILEAEQFHWSERDITWDESALKSFLNYSFKSEAFDSVENKMIYESYAGEIFVLSCDEIKYNVRKAPSATPYARIKANEEILSDVSDLWTRDTYKGEAYVYLPTISNDSFITGNMIFYRGVLPAMWIDPS